MVRCERRNNVMRARRRLNLPKWIIVLDVAGALLLAFGLVLLNARVEFADVSPADRHGLAIGMIVIGLLLMIPLVKFVVQRAMSSR